MNVTAADRIPESNLDVQLYYDYISQLAFVSSTVFNGTLPSRYANPEAAAVAARQVVGRVAQQKTGVNQHAVLIWHR